jgi:hypothetical protein
MGGPQAHVKLIKPVLSVASGLSVVNSPHLETRAFRARFGFTLELCPDYL